MQFFFLPFLTGIEVSLEYLLYTNLNTSLRKNRYDLRTQVVIGVSLCLCLLWVRMHPLCGFVILLFGVFFFCTFRVLLCSVDKPFRTNILSGGFSTLICASTQEIQDFWKLGLGAFYFKESLLLIVGLYFVDVVYWLDEWV